MYVNLYNTKIRIYKFVLIYYWQTHQKNRSFKKRASPLSPGTWECVRLLPKKWDTDACNLRHRLKRFCFCTRTIRTPHLRFKTYITPCKQVPLPVFFSIFPQPTSQVTNSIQENLLRHPQQPIASGEGNMRIPLHHLVGSCSGYLLIPYFPWSDACSQR